MSKSYLIKTLTTLINFGSLGVVPWWSHRKDLKRYRNLIISGDRADNIECIENSSNKINSNEINWSLKMLSDKGEEFLNCFIHCFIQVQTGSRQYNYAIVYRDKIYSNGLSQNEVDAYLDKYNWTNGDPESGVNKVILIHGINTILSGKKPI